MWFNFVLTSRVNRCNKLLQRLKYLSNVIPYETIISKCLCESDGVACNKILTRPINKLLYHRALQLLYCTLWGKNCTLSFSEYFCQNTYFANLRQTDTVINLQQNYNRIAYLSCLVFLCGSCKMQYVIYS